MELFKASVQYGDWQGTAAADEHQPSLLRNQLKSLMKPNEFLAAVSFWSSEGFTSIRGLVVQGEDFESAKAVAETNDPIPVREITLKIGNEEFVALFKRFHVMLTWRGLQLDGREYTATRT